MKLFFTLAILGALATISASDKIFTIKLTKHEHVRQVQVTNKLLDSMVSLGNFDDTPLTSALRKVFQGVGEKIGKEIFKSNELAKTFTKLGKAFEKAELENPKKADDGLKKPVVVSREVITEEPEQKSTKKAEHVKPKELEKVKIQEQEPLQKKELEKAKTQEQEPVMQKIPTAPKLTPKTSSFEQYLFDFREIQFVGQIAMGSKRLVRKVIFDSGSSILWVSNSKDSYASKKRTFDCDKDSTTCKRMNSGSKSVMYGSGSIDGTPVRDDIFIPQVSAQNSTFPNFKTEQLKETSGNYMEFSDPALSWGHIKQQEFDSVYNSPGMEIVQADGVLGMGPNDDPDIKSVMTSMFEQKIIDKQQFAFFYSIDEKSSPSSFTFGGYDKSVVAKSGESINWIPRVGDVHWTSPLEDLRIGRAKSNPGGTGVLFDSGSSWII